jgi:hypothetical protein
VDNGGATCIKNKRKQRYNMQALNAAQVLRTNPHEVRVEKGAATSSHAKRRQEKQRKTSTSSAGEMALPSARERL